MPRKSTPKSKPKLTDKERHRRKDEAYFTDAVYQPYALAIGQLSLAWNDLHEALGKLFATATGDMTGEQMYPVWHTPKADRPKREMLVAAAKNLPLERLRAKPKAETEILWLLGEADKLEDARNNAVHSPLLVFDPVDAQLLDRPTGVGVNDLTGNPRALRLARKDLLSEFRWCRNTALTLRDYAAAIEDVFWARDKPWPDRPQLPAH